MSKPPTAESPPVNMYESNGQLTLAIPMPGAHHDTIEILLEGRKLTVQAEARYAQEQQNYLHHEWSVGRSQREVELPKPVHAGGAKAMLTHGILTISLPIAEERSSPRVRIPVAEPPSHQPQSH